MVPQGSEFSYKEPETTEGAILTVSRLLDLFERAKALNLELSREDDFEWEENAVDLLHRVEEVISRAAMRLIHIFDLQVTVNLKGGK